MIDRPGVAIFEQVLLADIGGVARITILGEQVVERLFALRADFHRDRFVPFLAVGEDRINIENNTTKIEHPVTHDIADPEPGVRCAGRVDMTASLRGEE